MAPAFAEETLFSIASAYEQATDWHTRRAALPQGLLICARIIDMTLMIDLPPDLETQLQIEAAKAGIDAPGYVVTALKERMRQSHPQTLTDNELLLRISQGLPEEVWEQYHALVAKRKAETLTPDEYDALIALSDRIEEANVRRIEYVAELARLRQMPLNATMRSLGIGPRSDA